MSDAPSEPVMPPVDAERRFDRGTKVTLVAFGLIFLSMAGAVIYNGLRTPHVFDPLSATARDAVVGACAQTRDDLEKLGRLPAEITREQLAQRIDAEDELYSAMVGRLTAVQTSDEEGQIALSGWADDWRRVVEARRRYSADVRNETIERPDLALPTVSANGIKPVTEKMDEYATIHRLDGCSTTSLQIEIVEGPRRYGSGT